MGRKVGLLCMIVGVVGIVVSLLLLPAIWIGRAAVDDQIVSVANSVRDPLQQAAQSTAQVHESLTTIQSNLDQVGGQADSAAQSGAIEQQLAQRLLNVIDQTVGPAYVRLRDAYLNLRDRIVAATQAATALRQLLPGLTASVPTLPTDDLSAIDAQLQTMDATLRQLRADLQAGSLPDNTPGVNVVRRIDDGIQAVNTAVGTVSQRVDNLQSRTQQLLDQVDQAQANVERVLTYVAVGLSLLSVYLVLLHTALFAYGRQLRRPTETAGTQALAEPMPQPAAPAPSAATHSTPIGT
jgi:hypothetical protein